MAANEKLNLVVIVGPTASGKSALAIKIAGAFNGEIIAADSRTLYKGMDIGTAKPTLAEQALVPHWGLDLIEPGQTYSVAKFKRYTREKIADIQSRGKLPILVGGTGLYIDAVVFDFSFTSSTDKKQLYSLEVNQLAELIKQRGYQLPENRQNKRHLVRTIERRGQIGSRRSQLPRGCLIIGLLPDDKTLREAINQRAEQIFKAGMLAETKQLVDQYGRAAVAATAGIGYRLCLRVVDGDISEDEALELFKQADWRYARRQKTWFKRNKFIRWFYNTGDAFISVKSLLNN